MAKTSKPDDQSSGPPKTGGAPPKSDYSTAGERDFWEYRMLADLKASVAALRESVDLLREDVKDSARKTETKLDSHSEKLVTLSTEFQSAKGTAKLFGKIIALAVAILTLIWMVGSRLLEFIAGWAANHPKP